MNTTHFTHQAEEPHHTCLQTTELLPASPTLFFQITIFVYKALHVPRG